jgi:WD40 repeat protein
LSKAFSLQTREDVNGHKIRQITGWDHGLGGGDIWHDACSGYRWLDVNHLLLYPATGQVEPEGYGNYINVVPQPVVINLQTGQVWLPPAKTPSSPRDCNRLEWSSELGILIVPEEQDGVSTVSTYTYDGRKRASYPGSLMDVSPSGTKILLADSTVIDLRTNRKIILAWGPYLYSEDMAYNFYWTLDETRLYRCCYYYADLRAGVSYHSQRSDFQDTNDNQWGPQGWLVYRGGWIQNDTYFLPDWNWLDDGDIRYLPMLDPAQKRIVEVRAEAGIPEDWSCTDIEASPDGKYVWMTGFSDNYLVDLNTFQAQYYPREVYPYVNWSPNSKFALLSNNNDSYSILSMRDKKLSPVPVIPRWEWINWWHARDGTLIYPSKDKNELFLLDAAAMSFRKLPFKIDAGGYSSLVWHPDEETIAFVAEDGSVWQVDYPELDTPEQLMPALKNVYDLEWSPDGNSIAFFSGSDLYIVDTMK